MIPGAADARAFRLGRMALAAWAWLALLASPALAGEGSLAAALRAELQAFARTHAPAEARVEIPDLSDFEVQGLSGDDVRFELSTHPRTRWEGEAVPVTVAVLSDEVEQKRGVVAVRLESMRRVWSAVRPLRRGDVLSPADARATEVPAQRLPRDAVPGDERIFGLRALRSVGQGTVLRRSWLDEPAVVARGDVVRLHLATGGLRIEARGRAREEGRAGDSIRVTNTDSNRELVGRVGPDGVVHVQY